MKLHPEYTFSGGDRAWVGDVPYTLLNTSRIYRECGWQPTISTEESIRRTVRYLMEDGSI